MGIKKSCDFCGELALADYFWIDIRSGAHIYLCGQHASHWKNPLPTSTGSALENMRDHLASREAKVKEPGRR